MMRCSLHQALVLSALVLSAVMLPVAAARADHGYEELVARLGAENVPTGDGVVVGQVESPEGANYIPNLGNSEFAGKTLTPQSGASGTSSHANIVAQNFFGNTISFAPGVTTVYLWEVSHFLLAGQLRTGEGIAPLAQPAPIKVINHSYVGEFASDAADNNALRRADFMMNRDDSLWVVGVNNAGFPNLPIMSHNYNGISVGVIGGNHQAGDTVPGIDGAGRMKPEIVANSGATSFATPRISAAVAILTETARDGLARGGAPRGERNIVLKSVILGGAYRNPMWTNNAPTSGPDRGRTARPIDNSIGAGLLDINRAHLILTGGEHDGSASVPAAANISGPGWDFESVPGGQSRYYRFTVTATELDVAFLATWNRITALPFTTSSIANFNLTLWKVNGTTLQSLVGVTGTYLEGNAVSESAVDNIELVRVKNLQPGEYVLELDRIDASGSWDVALAWMVPAVTASCPADLASAAGPPDDVVNVFDLLELLANWNTSGPGSALAEPTNTVNLFDLLELLANWGACP